MAQPYVGEIRMFGGNFAPLGWMFCEGQILPIAENETLFNLIGTTYGGNGQETFGLPDLRGRVPVHQGGGIQLGQLAGTESVTLGVAQMPAHTHTMMVTSAAATDTAASGLVLAATASATVSPYGSDAPRNVLNAASISSVGGSQPHENRQPFLCVSFIISLFGIFPSQS